MSRPSPDLRWRNRADDIIKDNSKYNKKLTQIFPFQMSEVELTMMERGEPYMMIEKTLAATPQKTFLIFPWRAK